MKKSFGIITYDITDYISIDEFIDNALNYGHDIDKIYIAYTNDVDRAYVDALNDKVGVKLIQINHTDEQIKRLVERGVSKDDARRLLYSETLTINGSVAYGLNRNNVLLSSMLDSQDILFFVDTDVYPYVLEHSEDGTNMTTIDFVGEHMKYLQDDEVWVTTSDYSGYYIIPPMHFEGMRDYFIGLQKGTAYDFISHCYENHCLIHGRTTGRHPFASNKLLGGNLALKLPKFKELPAFFSSIYSVDGAHYLTRGEDTVLGQAFSDKKGKCMDIDLRIFHNTFGNYPDIPDIVTTNAIKERFIRASFGWVGRNPFLNWIQGKDLKAMREEQLAHMIVGSKAASRHFNDHRFLKLPQAIQIAYDNVYKMIDQYKRQEDAWHRIMDKYEDWRE